MLQNEYVMILLLLFYFIVIVDYFSNLKNKNSLSDSDIVVLSTNQSLLSFLSSSSVLLYQGLWQKIYKILQSQKKFQGCSSVGHVLPLHFLRKKWKKD